MKTFVIHAVYILAMMFVSTVVAGGKKKAKVPEHHDTVIEKVTADSITIDQEKVTKSFKITQFTEVTLRGRKAVVTDLQPGMRVSVTMGGDASVASRITAGDPPVHIDRPKSKTGRR